MKLVSWNVNGLRSAMSKGFADYFKAVDADIFAIQETKMQEDQKEFDFAEYEEYWNCADKKGYSGTLVYTKKKPLNVNYGIDGELYNDEGRVITLEFENFFFVNVYSPNSKPELARLDYRMEYENCLNDYLVRLDMIKPLILCGDLNVAHMEIDIKNPKANVRNAGFTIEERTKFTGLLEKGFVDSFRFKYPNTVKYTWWSYMFNARKNNAGWRIDYFVVSERIKDKIAEAEIHADVTGSDHCPVLLEINL